MGFFSSIGKFLGLGGEGGGSGSVDIQPLIPKWQMGLGEDLSSWVRKFLQLYSPGQPYGGKLSVTTPSTFEQTGLDKLGGFLGQPATGDLFGAAKGQVLDTLSGRYADPSTSPFIQSATRLAGQNLQDAITTARGQRGARGTFFTKAGIEEESRLSERTQNYLNTLIGSFIDQERQRQLSAVPQAESLERYGMEAPIKQITASQTLGALPRLLEQADLENRYGEFQRQRNELREVPGIGNAVFERNVPPLVATTAPGPSTINSLLSILGSLNLGNLPGGGGSRQDSQSGGGSRWMDLIIKLLPIILSGA